MSKIYEIDISLFNKIRMYPTYDKFIFKDKNKKSVVVVDNSSGDFFTEKFSNKTKGLIFLINKEFLPSDVEKEYKENKNKYRNYKKIVSNQNDYMLEKDLYDRDFLDFDSNKKYEFDINIGYNNCPKKFKSTIKEALGLASNYESNLVYNGIIIFSPLGFEWEYNNNLIHKYLKISPVNKKGIPLPYVYLDSTNIEWIKTESKDKNLRGL